MIWYDKIDFDRCCSHADADRLDAGRMGPGLTGEYNWELREKASVGTPPSSPACMGLAGEYDPCGLIKRVAAALDNEAECDPPEQLTLRQEGGKVVFEGTVPRRSTLSHLVNCASHVDGTQAVETTQVSVESPEH